MAWLGILQGHLPKMVVSGNTSEPPKGWGSHVTQTQLCSLHCMLWGQQRNANSV